MGKIGADIGLMREAARRMRAAAAQFEQHGGSTRAAVTPLAAAWSGAARDAAMDRWGAISPTFGGGAEALQAYAQMLEQIAAALERQANRSWWQKTLAIGGDVLGIAGGIFSFVFPPLGVALGLGSFGARLGAELPDLIRRGDWRGFTSRMASAAPLPPGVASQVIRTATHIAVNAHSLKDVVHMAKDAIPTGADVGYLGTIIKVADSKDVVDGALNATALFGQNDVVATAATITKLARADNAGEMLDAIGERLPPGSQEALRIIRDAAQAHTPAEALQTVLRDLPPGALEQIAPVLKDVLPSGVGDVAQSIVGLAPSGALPPAVQSAAGFIYATRDSLLPNAGQHWTSPGQIDLGPIQVGVGSGGIHVGVSGSPIPIDLHVGSGGVQVHTGPVHVPVDLRHMADSIGGVAAARPAPAPQILRDFFG